jgi:hypothetical protein
LRHDPSRALDPRNRLKWPHGSVIFSNNSAVAEAVARVMRRAETHSIIFEFGGPRVYSYEQFLRAVAQQAGVAPLMIPIRFAVWHALAWASEMFPSPLLTRNQVELMRIDTVSSPEMPGFAELEISPHSVEAILQKMLSNCG